MYENIALRLQLSPQELERESLRVFLNHRLRLVESQLLATYHFGAVASKSHLEIVER